MNTETEEPKRPLSITTICIIGFAGALMTILIVFSPAAAQVGAWYPPYLGLSAIVGLACMVGLWMMKKWAVFTYMGYTALNQAVLLAMGVWNILALLIPVTVILFSLRHIERMS